MLKKDRINAGQGTRSTASAEETAKFERLAREWRDPRGRFRAVHAFNEARIPLLQRELPRRLDRDPALPRPLAGLRLADIGCATGLVSEAMARAGADVFAIDAAAGNIAIAREAAKAAQLDIDYRVAVPEQIPPETNPFDAVLALEVVEHVADLDAFLAATARLVRPQGLLVVGTLNRTLGSFLKAIIGAEYVLGLLPRGTHDWRAFVRPQELRARLHPQGLRDEALFGLAFDPLRQRWSVTGDTGVNYMALFRNTVVAPASG